MTIRKGKEIMTSENAKMYLEIYKEAAEKLGISLEEYLMMLILDRLNDLHVTTYPAE